MTEPVKLRFIGGTPGPSSPDAQEVELDAISTITWNLYKTIEQAENSPQEAVSELQVVAEIITNGSGGTCYGGPPPAWKVGLLGLHMAALRIALETSRPDGADVIVDRALGTWELHPAAEDSIRALVDHTLTALRPSIRRGVLEEPDVPAAVRSEKERSAVWEVYHMTAFYNDLLPHLKLPS